VVAHVACGGGTRVCGICHIPAWYVAYGMGCGAAHGPVSASSRPRRRRGGGTGAAPGEPGAPGDGPRPVRGAMRAEGTIPRATRGGRRASRSAREGGMSMCVSVRTAERMNTTAEDWGVRVRSGAHQRAGDPGEGAGGPHQGEGSAPQADRRDRPGAGPRADGGQRGWQFGGPLVPDSNNGPRDGHD